MTYLEVLLEGAAVEWKPLGEIADFYGGLTGKKRQDFEDGDALYIPYRNIYNNPEVDFHWLEKVNVAPSERQHEVLYGDVLFTLSSETEQDVGMSSVVTTHFEQRVFLNSFSFGVRFHDDVSLLPAFTKHFFRAKEMRFAIRRTAQGVTRYNISRKKFRDILIPLPPLRVQERIVEILDKFTALEAELEAELEARKKQYEFYRNKLMRFGAEVEWKPLGEVAELKRGTSITQNTSTEGGYPVISGGRQPAYYVDQFNRTGETITVAGSGAYAGFLQYWNEPIFVGDAFSIKPDPSLLLTRFVYLFLLKQQQRLHDMKVGGAVPHVYTKFVAPILIPLPQLAVQEQIVAILDKFHTLVHSMSEGLPAEIALRRRQYEDYRNQLLRFPR